MKDFYKKLMEKIISPTHSLTTEELTIVAERLQRSRDKSEQAVGGMAQRLANLRHFVDYVIDNKDRDE